MPSTYSNLKIQLMATGENTGTWGNVTNDNLGVALEQAIVETATVTFASANVTLTLTDSNSRQDARALRLNLAGTTGGARDLIVPAIQKPYLVNNGTADTVTVKVSGQTGVAVPAGSSMLLYNNGTDVVLAFNRVVAEVVGNVTGNVSGSAATLQTARNIGITGGATAANVSFDGSSAVVLSVTGINVSTANAGTLAVDRGGTGQNTYTNGQLLIGSTPSGSLSKATLTAGTGITITNGAGSITVAASGAGGFSGSQGFNSPGTFSTPPTTNQVFVILESGGGGGGGSSYANSGDSAIGGGGGGGAFAMGVVPVTGGTPVSVTVGAGGNAGNKPGPAFAAAAGNAGGSGGASSFGNVISANGGAGGNGGGLINPGNIGNPGNRGAVGNGVAPTGIGFSGLNSGYGVPTPAPPSASVVGAGFVANAGLSGSGGNGPGQVSGNAGGAGFVFVAF